MLSDVKKEEEARRVATSVMCYKNKYICWLIDVRKMIHCGEIKAEF